MSQWMCVSPWCQQNSCGCTTSNQGNQFGSKCPINLPSRYFHLFLYLYLSLFACTRPWPAGLDGIVVRIQLHTPRQTPWIRKVSRNRRNNKIPWNNYFFQEILSFSCFQTLSVLNGFCHFPCFQTLPPSWAPQARSEAFVTVFERRSHLGPPARA